MTEIQIIDESNDENEIILNDIEFSQKRIDFLHNYRKILIEFSVNCICNQNKPLIKSIESLESQYNQLFRDLKDNENDKNEEIFVDKNSTEFESDLNSNDIQIISESKNKSFNGSNKQNIVNPIPLEVVSPFKQLLVSPNPLVLHNYSQPSIDCTPQSVTTTPLPSTVPLLSINNRPNNVISIETVNIPPVINSPQNVTQNILKEKTTQIVNKKRTESKSDRTKPKQRVFKLEIHGGRAHRLITYDDINSLNSTEKNQLLRNGVIKSYKLKGQSAQTCLVYYRKQLSESGEPIAKIVYRCIICGKEWNASNNMIGHIQRAHKGVGATPSSSIFISQCVQTGDTVLTVDGEDDKFSVIRKELLNPINEKTELGPILGYRCNYKDCPFICQSLDDMRQHLSCESEKSFECDVCHNEYESTTALEEHKSTDNHIIDRPFICQIKGCDFQTMSFETLTLHSVSHSPHTDSLQTPIKCTQIGCNKTFKEDSHLKDHMKRYHTKMTNTRRVYRCQWPNCGKQFEHRAELTVHKTKHTGFESTIECNLCGNKFMKYLLNAHKTFKHNIQDSNSVINTSVFPKKERITKMKAIDKYNEILLRNGRIQSFTMSTYRNIQVSLGQVDKPGQPNSEGRPQVLYKCVDDRWQSNNIYAIPRHLATASHITGFSIERLKQLIKSENCVLTVHQNDEMCSAVQQITVNQENGITQMSPILGYKCNFTDCPFVCLSPHKISEHMTVHRTGKTYKCNICNTKFGSSRLLGDHNRRHHSSQPLLECHSCDFQTFLSESLEQHNIWHKSDTPSDSKGIGFKTDQNGLYCDFPKCVEFYSNKSDLYTHMKTHKEEGVECDLCAKVLKSRYSVQTHKLRKHNIKNKPWITCPDCPFKTLSKRLMSEHSTSHRTDRPFKCDQIGCDKSFKTKYSLIKHKVLHSQQRPYPCEWPGCEWTFKKKTTQQKHLKTHSTDSSRFDCHYCDTNYKYKGDLNRHIKRDHLIDTQIVVQ